MRGYNQTIAAKMIDTIEGDFDWWGGGMGDGAGGYFSAHYGPKLSHSFRKHLPKEQTAIRCLV
jgi:hypothetical protein